jgi:peptide/nickel transport system permease protein
MLYRLWTTFRCRKLGVIAFAVVVSFLLIGIYAPFLAASKPLLVHYDGHWYFPLFRYLFFRGYYSKGVDLFFNLLMFILPLAVVACWLCGRLRTFVLAGILCLQGIAYVVVTHVVVRDPAAYHVVPGASWQEELLAMPPYARLNLVCGYLLQQRHHERLVRSYPAPPTPFARRQELLAAQLDRLAQQTTAEALHRKSYLLEKQRWLEEQKLDFICMPLLSHFHWEEDAGGDRAFNSQAKWYERTRINRKHLLSSLLFGIRVSLMVGIAAVALAAMIGVPLGALAGYYGGRCDLVLGRFTEIWESMPTFFMLLMIVAILHQKSLFLIILVMGLFGWTTYYRFVRAEVLKQRNLTYVEACRCQGMRDRRLLFLHILPNSIPPILTIIPFSIMNAITREAALSFLGLGEEGSTSWGVLMDEGRTVFPAESYLLWPPAIFLTVLLIAIALVGDALRDALDPRARS